MTFYHRTLHHASNITHSVIGKFFDDEKEDIIVSNGRILKLLRFEPGNTNSTIQTLISEDTYDIITSLSKIRIKDATKDRIVIATDSGTTTILAVNAEKMEFEVYIQDKFQIQTREMSPFQPLVEDSKCEVTSTESDHVDSFKYGISRTFPIQHMAVDSHGRAVFIAAMEDRKRFLFLCGPGNQNLEIVNVAEKNTLIYDIAFVDINSENIVIAYLAAAYEELHPGVKYEIRKRQKPSLIFCEVKPSKVSELKQFTCLDYANSLISVPGERGVLVCAEDFIAFYSLDSPDIIRCSIPKRIKDPKVGVIFVCSTKCSKQNSIYYLVQTEQGDIFRIQLIVGEHGVNEIVLKYLITVPVASALCTFESGYLFVASEFGDHHIYRIADIEKCAMGHPLFSSTLDPPKGEPFLFLHRNLNVVPVSKIKSLSPIMHMEFEPLSYPRTRMCLATGRASLSTLQIFKPNYKYHGEIENDEMKQGPMKMWAINSILSFSEKSLTLVVVTFEFSTAVYSLGTPPKFKVEKMESLPFATKTNTLGCAKTGEGAIVQVCPEAVCLITKAGNKTIYKTESNNPIEGCAMNKKSLIIALKNKVLQHYDIDENGYLNPLQSDPSRRVLNAPVTCMLVLDKIEYQLLAVGISIPPQTSPALEVTADKATVNRVNEVHLFMISSSEIMVPSILKVDSSPYSFLFVSEENNHQHLLVGCENGTLLTLVVEQPIETKGTTKTELKIVKSEKIGSEAVELLKVPTSLSRPWQMSAGYGILAISNHSWFRETAGDFIQLKSDLSPCICIVLESEIIATVVKNQLRVYMLRDLRPIPSVTFPLKFTPKKFVISSFTRKMYIIETDNNSYTEETMQKKRKVFDEHVEPRDLSELPAVENIPKSWASILRVVNLSGENPREVLKLHFKQNEAVLSLCLLEEKEKFLSSECDGLLLVGVAEDFKLSTKCCSKASIYTYKIWENGRSLEKFQEIKLRSAPFAMCCYAGEALVGIGRKLAIYGMEENSCNLVKICEKKDCVSNSITALYPVDNRIWVSDSDFGMSGVICYAKDNSSHSQKITLHLLEEDISPPEVTAACIFNDDQMARATKSRNIFIVELGTSEDKDKSKIYNDDEIPFTLFKEKLLGCFHVGEVVTCMQKFRIFADEPEAVVYTTLSGTIGILSWREDAKLLNLLNASLLKFAKEIDKKRTTLPILPKLQFRSRHYKCKNVIDGDLLDEFLKLEVGFQNIICKEIKDAEEIMLMQNVIGKFDSNEGFCDEFLRAIEEDSEEKKEEESQKMEEDNSPEVEEEDTEEMEEEDTEEMEDEDLEEMEEKQLQERKEEDLEEMKEGERGIAQILAELAKFRRESMLDFNS